jgi:hypothetical protein
MVVAAGLALVLAMGSNAWATSRFCPPKHTCSGPPGVQTGDPSKDNSCNAIFQGSPTGSLVKTTTAGPNDSVVAPGQTITMTLKWDKGDFGWAGPAEAEDCVEIGGKISKLSQEHGRAPLGGTDKFTYRVPSATNGQPICDRGVVFGYGATGSGWSARWTALKSGHRNNGPERSEILYYSILGAATPEAPNLLFFPVAAAFVGGAGYLVARRRRRRTTPLHQSGRLSLSMGTGRHGAGRRTSRL